MGATSYHETGPIVIEIRYNNLKPKPWRLKAEGMNLEVESVALEVE